MPEPPDKSTDTKPLFAVAQSILNPLKSESVDVKETGVFSCSIRIVLETNRHPLPSSTFNT